MQKWKHEFCNTFELYLPILIYYQFLRAVIPTCSTRTPKGKRRTGWGYAKIVLVMAEITKKKELKGVTKRDLCETCF
jgi:hypothetical protein